MYFVFVTVISHTSHVITFKSHLVDYLIIGCKQNGWGVLVYSNAFLMVVVVLLFVTMGVAVLYYRRIKRADEMYEEARDAVGDVIISFNRQLQRQEDRLGAVAYETEVLSFRSEEVVKKLKAQDRRLADLAVKVEAVSGLEQRFSTQIENVNKKVKGIIAKQESLMKKIAEVPAAPEAKIKAAIPIKRERALASLTETELGVLEILASEGKKTAPEIRARIKLTREHTARLMKKLYEKGYLERETGKMPYAYSIKEEMRRILKKTEAKT